MPDLPARPSLTQIRKQAKALRKACANGDPEALARLREHLPESGEPSAVGLRDAQLVVAREYGFDGWTALAVHVESESGKEDHKEIRRRRMEQQTSSEEEIARVVEVATGSEIAEKRRMTDGFSSETWWITTTDGRDVMYRANWYNRPGVRHYENEAWGLGLVDRHDLPGPRCLHIEHDLPGHPRRSVIVNTRVPGVSLKSLIDGGDITDSDRDRLLRDFGALLGRIHEIEAPAYTRVLYPEGVVSDKDWRARYGDSFDLPRLRQSADNAGLPWSIVQEGLDLLASTIPSDPVTPSLLHGDSDTGHLMIHEGEIAGLIDFERCTGGDPAEEAGFGKETLNDSWWSPFTGEEPQPISAAPFFDGYRSVVDVDDAFIARSCWHRFRNQVGGLQYHGVNDVNTAGMMPFLNWRYREDLKTARELL